MNEKVSQKNLLYRFEQKLKKTKIIKKGDKVVVALSGGPDSVCLFDLLCKLQGKLGIEVLACHYNHKIRGGESNADQSFVEELCHSRGVKLIVGTYGGKRTLKSEEEAREARYAFFKKILKKGRGAKLAIAHNSNDLSETFLFRLLRGSGPRGLKSIPSRRKKFIRPLLDFSRKEIEKYLEDQGLKYRKDSSNEDLVYKRNYIRKVIIPELTKINPKALDNINNFSKLLAEQNRFIDKAVEAESKRLVKENENGFSINRNEFIELDKVIQSNLLLCLARKLGYTKDISSLHVDDALKLISKGEGRKHLTLPHSLRIELRNGKINLL